MTRTRQDRDRSAFPLETAGRDIDNRPDQPFAPDPSITVGRRGFEEALRQLADAQALTFGHTTALLALAEAGVVNDVLETGTRTIPAAGYFERKWQAPFAGLMVINTSAGMVTVQEGGPTAAAQGDGPGSFLVPAFSQVTIPLTGRSATFYGPAGARITYTVLTRRPEPTASMGTTPGTAANPTVTRIADGTTGQLATVGAGGALTVATAPPIAAGGGTSMWNAVAVLAAGVSALISTPGFRSWFIFGNTTAATTLTVQVSADAVTWRSTAVTVAANGDFSIDCRALVGAWYTRLLSSAPATITAGIMGNY